MNRGEGYLRRGGGGRGFYRGGGGGGGYSHHHAQNSSEERVVSETGRNVSGSDSGPLAEFFRSVDGGNYGMLKQLTNRTFPLPCTGHHSGLSLTFLSVQPDPFAPGSQVRVALPTPFSLPPCDPHVVSEGVEALSDFASISPVGQGDQVVEAAPSSSSAAAAAFYDGVAQVAAEDYVLRCVRDGLQKFHRSGALQFLRPSQHVLPRSAVALTGERARETHLFLRVKLPGHGRRIDGRGAIQILLHELLPLIESCVCDLDPLRLMSHVTSVLDQEWLRHQLRPRRLVAFVADNAVLPRAAGDSDLPLDQAIPFVSPARLSVAFKLPFSGRDLTGMGLPRGLTLIAGGGFHGKSTLLRALELGIYNHVPSDGRAFVVTDPTAVKIRAEDRRAIHGVNISPFIRNLPFQRGTTAFATSDASGSTSQAANIIEALEMGSSALLLDEDTSATNFMYRDALMQQLVPPEQEPITPFVERVRELIDEHDVSAVMVVGGSGQYFAAADVVLVLNCYKISDCTMAAKAIVAATTSSPPIRPSRNSEFPFLFATVDGEPQLRRQQTRHLLYEETFDFIRLRKGRDSTKISGIGLDTVRVSDENIDLGMVEQLVEEGQLNAIAQCLALVFDSGMANVERAQEGWMVKQDRPYPPTLSFPRPAALSRPAVTDFHQLVANAERQLRAARLELQQPSCYLPVGFTALPRTFEIAAAFNRLRTLRTRVK